jgi:hypothetical protein
MSDFDAGLLHYNYAERNTVVNWNGTDTQKLFEKNCADVHARTTLQRLGWLDPNCITYKFNSFGFRDEEFDSRVCGLALGCSHTQGVGLPESSTWPRLLSQLTDVHVWNLGVGGSSIDTAFRLLDRWIEILNPKFVVCCLPDENRVEIFDHTNPVSIIPANTPFQLLPFYKVWVTQKANSVLLKRKNLLAMQQLCDRARIPLRYLDYQELNTVDSSHDGVDSARDLLHFGRGQHLVFAQKMYKLLQKQESP